jgi:hypothetical protein
VAFERGSIEKKSIDILDGRVVSSGVVHALGMLPENGNVMPKHVGATIHN